MVRFTQHLPVHVFDLAERAATPGSLAKVIREPDAAHPGLAGYLLDDQGASRAHLNEFGTTTRHRYRSPDHGKGWHAVGNDFLPVRSDRSGTIAR